jgi:hypothetical protein
LWLLFAVVVEVTVIVVVVLVTAAAALSALRDGLDREELVDVVVDAASANVAMAGVEGLLARPLLVLTALAAAGWMAREAASFFDGGAGSSFDLVGFSFLLPFCVGSAVGGDSSVSCFSGLGLLRIATVVSFWALVSDDVFALLLGWPGSGVPCECPFGLLAAAEPGRCRAFSAFDCVEF